MRPATVRALGPCANAEFRQLCCVLCTQQFDDTNLGNISDGVRSAAFRSEVATRMPGLGRPHLLSHLSSQAARAFWAARSRVFDPQIYYFSTYQSHQTGLVIPGSHQGFSKSEVPTGAHCLVLPRAFLRRTPPAAHLHLLARLRWNSAFRGLRTKTTRPMYSRHLTICVRKTNSLWPRM